MRVRAGDLLFLAGQIALNPSTMDLVDGKFRDEVKQVFKNVEAVLKGGELLTSRCRETHSLSYRPEQF